MQMPGPYGHCDMLETVLLTNLQMVPGYAVETSEIGRSSPMLEHSPTFSSLRMHT